MTRECDMCCEHHLDCICEKETQAGFLYAMPMGGTLEIRSTRPVEEDIGWDKEIEGILYKIYWDGVQLPYCAKTLSQATAIGVGCQWGAQEMIRKFRES